MIRRFVRRAGVVAACLFLSWGITSLRGATVAVASSPVAAEQPSPLLGDTVASLGVSFGPSLVASASTAGDRLAPDTVHAGEGVATIPLPPSAYPGMVGLATAALSVWRYRRRRR